jgi:hypothetical protein
MPSRSLRWTRWRVRATSRGASSSRQPVLEPVVEVVEQLLDVGTVRLGQRLAGPPPQHRAQLLVLAERHPWSTP